VGGTRFPCESALLRCGGRDSSSSSGVWEGGPEEKPSLDLQSYRDPALDPPTPLELSRPPPIYDPDLSYPDRLYPSKPSLLVPPLPPRPSSVRTGGRLRPARISRNPLPPKNLCRSKNLNLQHTSAESAKLVHGLTEVDPRQLCGVKKIKKNAARARAHARNPKILPTGQAVHNRGRMARSSWAMGRCTAQGCRLDEWGSEMFHNQRIYFRFPNSFTHSFTSNSPLDGGGPYNQPNPI